MLYIFGGLPGSGKTTIARRLSERRGAVYLRIDTIEQAMINCGVSISGPEGYIVAYKVAEDNLRIGGAVVADSVNPIEQTRAAWRRIAEQCDAPFVEIEVVCSDTAVHKRRVETRRADIPNQELPTWRAVQQRQVEPWNSATVVLDTAHRTVFESLAELEYHLKARKIG